MQPSDLRVALFSGNYNYVRDGANQALNRLVGYLLARGVQVRVYSPTVEHPAFAPTGDLISIPSLRVPGERGEFRFSPIMTAKIRRDLDAFRPNIVHVSAPEFVGHRALAYAEKRDIPVLASLHTRFETYPRYYNLGFLEKPLIGMLKRFYQRADTVVVPGASLERILHDWGVTSDIRIWARGVDHDRFNPKRRSLEWRRSLGIEDHEVAVGFLGRLVREKGLDVFSDVCTELTRRGVPHKVLVVGKGPSQEWFAERVPEAKFAGFQAGDDLGRAVASMDLFFNPSVTETFGNVTLEAMAAGVPVVAAHATGTMDLVVEGETGMMVPARDVGAYADAIQYYVEHPDARTAAGAAGHARAEGYRWDDINENVLKAYLDTLARHGK